MVNPFDSARSHLWNGQERIGSSEKYICHALQRAADRRAITQAEADQAREMIYARLGEYPSVEGWLCCEAGIRLGEMDPVSVQDYRFLWLGELSSAWNQGERT
jgi:hypothetical protein